MTTPAKLALIGTGGIAGAHIQFLRPDVAEYVALCDVNEANIAKAQAKLASPAKTFTDWREMLDALGDDIDGVDICLPHHLHAPAILDAARAGRHVICEKPLCLNLAEADEIARVVDEAGIIFAASHNQLFIPAIAEAKRRIDGGEIGDLRWIRLQENFVAGGGFDGTWRADLATQGGGVLIDTGYHPTYTLLHLAGFDVTEVKAVTARHALSIEGEDTANVVLKFASGATGEIMTSWALPMPIGTHRLHVIGSEGQLYGSTDKLWIARPGSQPEQIDCGQGHGIGESIAHFVECVREGRRPIHGVREARKVLEVILAATA